MGTSEKFSYLDEVAISLAKTIAIITCMQLTKEKRGRLYTRRSSQITGIFGMWKI